MLSKIQWVVFSRSRKTKRVKITYVTLNLMPPRSLTDSHWSHIMTCRLPLLFCCIHRWHLSLFLQWIRRQQQWKWHWIISTNHITIRLNMFHGIHQPYIREQITPGAIFTNLMDLRKIWMQIISGSLITNQRVIEEHQLLSKPSQAPWWKYWDWGYDTSQGSECFTTNNFYLNLV